VTVRGFARNGARAESLRVRDKGGNSDKNRNMLAYPTDFDGFEGLKTAPRKASIRIFPRKAAASA
jgi:hypothetical protein